MFIKGLNDQGLRDEAISGYYAVKKKIKRILIFPFLAPYICGSRMSLYCVIGLHGFLEISVFSNSNKRRERADAAAPAIIM